MDYLTKVFEILKKNYNFNGILNEHTPVRIDYNKMPDNQVMITKDVYEAIEKIKYISNYEKKEIGFIMYGKEYKHNKVILNRISVSDAPLDRMVATFGEKITNELSKIIDENLDERTVVVHSHTHPNINDDYNNFSLGDLTAYMEFTNNIDDFKEKNMQLIGCLLTDKILKFIYYNPYDENFYEMDNIKIYE